jgi:hypothetical protein
MSFQIRWIPHVATSALHAAEALLRRAELVDPQLTTAVRAPGWELAQEIASHGVHEVRYWRQLLYMAHQFENKRQLAQITLFRAFGRTKVDDAVLVALAGRLHDLQLAYNNAFPNMADELEMRARPLREQWEARGPGMLKIAVNLLDEKVLVPGADVLLVQPAYGGFGSAQLYNNTVRMEAMLANPHDRLPEVVRLLWTFLQLNLDLPMFSEKIHGDRLPAIAAMAMLPVALHTAEQVELVKFDADLLKFALDAWHLDLPNNCDAVSILTAWWDVYRTTKTPLPVALQALDEMIGG